MSAAVPTQPADLVADLLLEWQDARDRGEPRSAEALCASRPDLLADVRGRIAALEAMHALLHLDKRALPNAGPDRTRRADDLPDLPGYDVIGLIDEGGMGTVYHAVQPMLRREVAVKMVRAGRLARADQLARFRAEAEAVARLDHPNIVRVHEVGEWHGRPYFSMEYVPDGDLARHLSRGLVPPREAAELVRALADAINHAHGRGVVHRDLKPANVLLRRKPSSGAGAGTFDPLVGDFGLAKILDAEDGPTRTGVVVGTPQYLAPEQAEGRAADVGPATDVHALGVILYEMLAGRPPFLGANTLEVLDRVRAAEPLPPSRVQAGVPLELEAVCLKCIAKEPAARYASAADLADDLGRYLSGEPVRARRTPAWRRAAGWARRQPVVAALSAFAVVAVAALLVVWADFTYRLKAAAALLQEERDEADRRRAAAEEDRRTAEAQSARSEYLLMRCMSDIDEHARATASSRELKQVTGEHGSIPFAVARAYAASSAAYRNDERLSAADREKFAERYAAKSVELLADAAAHRFFENPKNRARLFDDADLAVLRDRGDFRALQARRGIRR